MHYKTFSSKDVPQGLLFVVGFGLVWFFNLDSLSILKWTVLFGYPLRKRLNEDM